MDDGMRPDIGLLAFAAHEIQAPLRRIRAFAALLETAGPEEAEQARRVILREAERAQQLAADLIAWDRLEVAPAAPRPLALDALVAELVEGLPVAEGAEIACDLAPLTLEADPHLVRPLVSNLLANALAHRRPGAAARVRITLSGAPGGAARLTVADDGIGFDPAHGEELFKPFVRRSTAVAGSGLGLAIVRAAADRLGWSITPASAPGGGSTFVVDIPGREP